MITNPVVVVLTLASLIGLAGCAAPRADQAPAAPAIRVAKARVPETSRGLRYAATVQASEQLTLAVKGNGYVAGIHQVRANDGRQRTLQPGDAVRAGTILVWLRDAEYRARLNQSVAALEEVEASHVKARLDLDRARLLFAAESLTKPEIDGAQSAFDTATARLNSAHAQVETAKLALDDCVLVAPIDAVVLERRLEAGMLAGAGAVAFVLGRVAEVKALFGVPDAVVSRLTPGQPLTMTTEAIVGVSFAGRVSGVGASADSESRLFTIEVTLQNHARRLRPGMIGAIEVPTATGPVASADSTTVPLAAIVRSPHNPAAYGVFVVEAIGGRDIARMRTVTLGAAAGNAVAVTEGLRTGERVVVMGASLVTDGEPVRIIP